MSRAGKDDAPRSPGRALSLFTLEERYIVDGERFSVRKGDEPGEIVYTCLTGRNPGIGFSADTSRDPGDRPKDHVRRIKQFMAEVEGLDRPHET